jgi:hypothetical protein
MEFRNVQLVFIYVVNSLGIYIITCVFLDLLNASSAGWNHRMVVGL